MSAEEVLASPPADLAVVVVNYNAGEYLARCVMSVIEASGSLALDLLVVDNASRDSSAVVAAARTTQVRIINNPTNRGPSGAWNQGARAVDAPWILFLNPDGTIYESGRPFPGVVQAVGHAFFGPFAPSNRFTRAYRQTSWDRSTEREVDWVSGAAMLIRRSAFEQVGGFDEAFWLYGEELDLCTRLRDMGWKVLASPGLEVLHEGGVSTGRSRRTHLMHSQSIFRYYRKHRATGWRQATLPLAWAALRARAELVALNGRVLACRARDRAR